MEIRTNTIDDLLLKYAIVAHDVAPEAITECNLETANEDTLITLMDSR